MKLDHLSMLIEDKMTITLDDYILLRAQSLDEATAVMRFLDAMHIQVVGIDVEDFEPKENMDLKALHTQLGKSSSNKLVKWFRDTFDSASMWMLLCLNGKQHPHNTKELYELRDKWVEFDIT